MWVGRIGGVGRGVWRDGKGGYGWKEEDVAGIRGKYAYERLGGKAGLQWHPDSRAFALTGVNSGKTSIRTKRCGNNFI